MYLECVRSSSAKVEQEGKKFYNHQKYLEANNEEIDC
jgi:hypothetical protein